jgi:hypothetical protein
MGIDVLLQRIFVAISTSHGPSSISICECVWKETVSCPWANREHFQQRHDGNVLDAVHRSPTSCAHNRCSSQNITFWQSLSIQRVQRLLPWDYAPRVEFCEWLQANLDLLIHIDEATLTCESINNRRNSHTWAHQNLRNITVCSYQHRHSVWITRQLLIGPHFFRGHFTGVSYICKVTYLAVLSRMTPPMDAACSSSSHYQRINSIAQWTFCWSMVRRKRTCTVAPSVTWPISIRLSHVGLHEIRVYLNGKTDTREQLMQWINEAAVSIRNELVSMQWIQLLEVHLVACVQARGEHFEQYVMLV